MLLELVNENLHSLKFTRMTFLQDMLTLVLANQELDWTTIMEAVHHSMGMPMVIG